MCCSISIGYALHRYLNVKKYYVYVQKVKDHKTKTGVYPDTLTDEGPYYSLSGNKVRYRNFRKGENPLLWIEVVPPFGRIFYNFETNTETYLD